MVFRNYLFGGGHFALPIKFYLEQNGIKFSGIIVTKKETDFYYGTRMFELNEVSNCNSCCRIYFALSEKYHSEVEYMLRLHGFNDFVKYSDEKLNFFYKKANNLRYFLVERYYDLISIKNDKPNSYKNILVIRLDGIGDMVLSTPFFRELRRSYPNSDISLITSEVSYNLFEFCPYIDNVISVNWKKELVSPSFVACQLENARTFMKQAFPGKDFDVAIVPRYDVDYYGASFLALFSGATYRVAFSENVKEDKKKFNKDYDMIFSLNVFVSGVSHEVERNMQLLNSMGLEFIDDALELWSEESDYKIVKGLLPCNNINPLKKIIAIGLSASHKGRVWPSNKYVSLIDKINSYCAFDCLFVLLGADDQFAEAAFIYNNVECNAVVNLCGKVTLRQIFVIMKDADLYIGHDTGLMHIAAAAKCSIVEICATPPNASQNHPSSTLRFEPWKTKFEIVRPKSGVWDDGWKNINNNFAICDITVDEVFGVVKKFL